MSNQNISEAVQPENSIFEDGYFKETQTDIWNYERKKTMTSIFIVAAAFFLGDLFALIRLDALSSLTFIYSLLVPALFAGAGLFSKKEPLLSIVIVAVLFFALMMLTAYKYGAVGIIGGWLVKVIILVFLLLGFNHAREAEKARRNLKAIR